MIGNEGVIMSIGNIIALFILVIYLLMVIRVFIVDEIKYYKRKKKYKVILEELGKLIKVEEEE